MAIVTLLRHHYFLTSAYDMGFYIHDVWRIAHGEWTSTMFGFHIFADHFSPIMILLAPFAYLDTATGLLVVQALAVGSAVIPAYRLGRHLGAKRLGWLCALWLALSAGVWHTVFYDFRPATLGFVALVWLIAEMEVGRRMWLVWALAALAASAREDVAVFTGIALLIHASLSKDRRFALPGVASVGVGLWYTLVGQRMFAPFEYFMWYRYADYGAGPLQALADPGYAVPTVLERLVRPEVLVAFSALLLPVLVLPAFREWRRTWPAFLIMLGNGVSGAPFIPTVYYQYYILAVAFLIWGAAHALAEPAVPNRIRLGAPVTLVVFLLLGPVLSHQSTPYGRSIVDVVAAGERTALADELPNIGADESVSAGNVILPQLAERHQIFSYPLPMECGEVIQRYTPSTGHPDWVVILTDESPELDLESLGYERIDDGGWVEAWRATGDHPDPRRCPSAENLRRSLFEQISNGVSDGSRT